MKKEYSSILRLTEFLLVNSLQVINALVIKKD